MSTISKINPGTRQARAARRNAIRSLQRAIPYIPMPRRLDAILLHTMMEEVRRGSRHTGQVKSAVFATMMQTLMPATAAQLEAAA